METAVRGVFILGAALRAQGKAGHRGISPVVGDIADDGQAGTAVRAVDERITVPAIPRILQLPQTVVADGKIGRDHNVLIPVVPAGSNLKGLLPADGKVLLRDGGHLCGGREVVQNGGDEPFNVTGMSLNLDDTPFRGIADEPAKVLFHLNSVDGRPK
jgi:hypothetical protein